MTAQVLELLFFAGIAFFIISRLISTLGITSDDDPTKRKSFFGEKTSVKDVTGTANNNHVKEATFIEKKSAFTNSGDDFSDLIISDNIPKILEIVGDIKERLPNFNLRNFLKNSKSAFGMIIEAGKDSKENLELLIDKRYVEHFKSIITRYGDIEKINNLDAKILDIYTFGNNVFIKILFSGQNITSNISDFNEEWIFSKSLIQAGPDWYLANIEHPQ